MKLSKTTKTEKCWILYDWANSVYFMLIATILPIYFISMCETSGLSKDVATSYWGYANAISSFLVVVVSPILGNYADYMGLKSKLFKIFSLLGIIFTGSLMFVGYGEWIILMVFYILSMIGFSLSNLFYDAFLVDVTSEERMDYISSIGYAYGYIGSTIPFIVCMVLIILSQNNLIPLSTTLSTKISFGITAIWWFIYTLPMLKNVKQIYGKPYKKVDFKDSFGELLKSFNKIKKDRKIFIFLIAYFFYIDGVGTIIKMSASFATVIGIDSTTLLVVFLVVQFVAFPFSIIYGKLSVKYNIKTMLLIGISTYIIVCIVAFFMDTSFQFWILSLLVGSAQGGIQALSRSYFARMVPKENSNEYFGFYNILGKFAAVMGPLLVAIITQVTNNVRYGIFSIIILFIIGAILLIKNVDVNN